MSGPKKYLLVFLGLFSFLIVVLGLDIYTYPQKQIRENADAAIVLGAAIWGDEPSPVFIERLNHAAELFRLGKIKNIVVTGGLGEKEKYSEAEIGEKYLIRIGIPPEIIFREATSKTTLENLQNSVPILAESNISTVFIVSDPLHLRRAVMMARNLGMDAYPAATPTTRFQSFYSQASFLLREIYFYLGYLVLGR